MHVQITHALVLPQVPHPHVPVLPAAHQLEAFAAELQPCDGVGVGCDLLDAFVWIGRGVLELGS
jgi:hypothetical protein